MYVLNQSASMFSIITGFLGIVTTFAAIFYWMASDVLHGISLEQKAKNRSNALSVLAMGIAILVVSLVNQVAAIINPGIDTLRGSLPLMFGIGGIIVGTVLITSKLLYSFFDAKVGSFVLPTGLVFFAIGVFGYIVAVVSLG